MKQKAVDGTHTAGKWLCAQDYCREWMWGHVTLCGHRGWKWGKWRKRWPSWAHTVHNQCKQCARTQETVFVHIRQYTHNQSKEHTNSTHNKRCFFIQCVRTKSSTTTPSAWFKHIMCNQNSVQTMCTICPPCAIACTPATLCCLQSLNTVYLSGKCIVPGTLYAGNLTLCMHVVGSFHRAQQSDGAHLGFRKTMHIML